MASLVLILSELLQRKKKAELVADSRPPSSCFPRESITSTSGKAGKAVVAKARRIDGGGDAWEEYLSEAKVSVESIWP
ncbi:hypothetical protein OPV22_017041 [Ensete ventricosum]|uniref:Uncharacterized protein n=2 Tax=Ensete ventricosum TaxID=4639 RepID=A0A444CWI3_ENSVE|nr:hypothetical protein OPV22_017041 [Ensete ventricosum]RWV90210.1 hypothetical protein GW17_00047603 [Ensete ventricosum]RWW70809.1 hypothetical protein BHE74_00021494 [Ensete ventricosum]RZR75408.1 hypothetical protein BHM03_00056627 [Ensete ventricosum]